MPAPARVAAIAVSAALLLVAAWEVAWTRHAATSAPGDDAWREAAAMVRAEHRPGDLIVFAPDWVDPVGRMHLGDLIPITMAARMDAAKYGRIWELSIRGAHAPETVGLAPVLSRDAGGVAVRRFERPPAVVLADVRELLGAATVTGGAPTLVLAEVGFAPHRCIQITPAPKTPARITFPSLPAGELVGYVGLADVFRRRAIRSPATLTVEVGGQTVATAIAGIDSGWVRFAATLPVAGPVTFVAAATERERLVCFAAEVRR